MLRAGQWSEVSTEELVPGDLFAFKNDGTDGDPNTPCDALLLQVGCNGRIQSARSYLLEAP